MERMNALKVLLRAAAAAIFIVFGLSHILFPKAYFDFFGIPFDQTNKVEVFLAAMCGAVVIALCAGLWIAAKNPLENRPVMIQIMVAGTLTVIILGYCIFILGLSKLELINMAAVAALTILIGALYPWRSS